MPSAVVDKMVRIHKSFLWGWGSEGRKIAWVYWKNVCEPREIVGLSIKDLRIFNLALLGKWNWRSRTDKSGLWKEILESKYGGWRSLREDRNRCRGSLW